MRILGFVCLMSIACSDHQPLQTGTTSDDDDDENGTIAGDNMDVLAVSLTQPASAETVSASQSVTFEGTVSDPLERWSNLIAYWTSDADGHLGEALVDDHGEISLTASYAGDEISTLQEQLIVTPNEHLAIKLVF